MLSREFRKIYHPKLGRYVYQHRGNVLIIDNILKLLKSTASKVASKAASAASSVASSFGKKAAKKVASAPSRTTKKAQEKSGDLIRKRLSKKNPRCSLPRSQATQTRQVKAKRSR